MLDADEYLHLAIHASQTGNHHAALDHLHKALEQNPGHVGARYFLAAEHAELGLFERACSGMGEVLAVAPDMDIARFQFGLLNLQLERPDVAKQAFTVLAESIVDASLKAFSNAYLLLLDERRAEAKAHFEQGLSQCSNPALQADMLRVLSSLSSDTVGGGVVPPEAAAENSAPVYLGAYRNPHETL